MVVATLALGIGANSALFSLADRLFLRQPAGVAAPDGLRRFYARSNWSVGGVTVIRDQFNYPSFHAMGENIGDRAHLAAYTPPDSVLVGDGDAATSARGSYASADLFSILGVHAARGRLFTPAEDRMGDGALVAVIGDALWHARFGGDPTVIGRSTMIARQRYTIIGVLPPGFTGVDLDPVDIWLPLATYPAQAIGGKPWYAYWRSGSQLRVLARAAPNTVDEWLASVATAAFRRGEIANVETDPDTATVLSGPILAARGPSIKPRMEVAITTRLVGVAIIVLLIACANVSNLLLARALRRRREIAIRIALGVPRARLIAQLLAEGIVLSLVAGVGAIGVGALGGLALQRTVLSAHDASASALDWRIVGFSIGVAILTGVVAGLSPAFRASRPDLTRALKSGAREGGSANSRLRTALVVAQAALSVILLVGAGLFVASLGNARAIDLGFDPDRLLFGTVQFVNEQGHYVEHGSAHINEISRGLSEVAARLRGTEGVESVALATAPPMEGYGMVRLFLDGGARPPRLDNLDPALIAATPNYFATAGIRLARGRLFTDRDDAASEPVIVVNQTTARAYWPGKDPLAQCVYLFRAEAPCSRVIGVTRDFHLDGVVEQPMVGLVVPTVQQTGKYLANPSYLIVRASAGAMGRAALATRRAIRGEFPTAEPPLVQPISTRVNQDLATWRLGASLFSVFGILALIVAAIGVYSVIAYSVSQRAHEMGVRVALGARGIQVMSLVVGEGMRTVGAGLLIGVVLALALGRLVESMLYGTSPRDPIVFGSVAAVLAAVALLAAALPAWRASRVDPALVLRGE